MNGYLSIRIARVYEITASVPGEITVLVDRLWPRGFAKNTLPDLIWKKDWAPSEALRQWFHANSTKFDEFRERYREELSAREDSLGAGLQEVLRNPRSDGSRILLLYASRDREHNNAVVLRDYLLSRGRPRPIP